ncbi:apolipoprotein N-acyltransferase [Capnocytophaga ochracea DSM 7271]|uniref:Apolipoprotein N-acyltransferase n=1 Tax=Capnocytophaga ochracea (strain ATCC 27872 / DSM 7271 / CCUG 9716 / JCM 12966 / NCTC 12371 / SS31 / VPI 2845) TaxID=521097 RepID=C7M6M3_CAPOD|nr:apolipoprotein N-acyltransferase [Capnocytophaga ochracea]ACU92011.1 apolipoprotein N-acyltransferase [Capnocytophaga ochracea DSM 7271]UAK50780.1 apolipoprotein N-acyltransferase [Capnocytophaga ochracea]
MKKNILLALLSGALLACAWVTYGITALIFIALVPLLLMEARIRRDYQHTKRKVFALSYLAFLTWNIPTTWWIWYSTQIGAIFAILANTLLMTLTFFLYHIVAKRMNRKVSLVFLVAIWLSFEKFHLTWDVSWPWLNLGNVFSEQVTWIQWYEYTGTFGGSLWVWLVNIVLFIGLTDYLSTKNRKAFARKVGVAMLFFAIPVVISYFQYINYSEAGKKTINAIVLQPNIDPYQEKYALSNQEVGRLLVQLASENIDDQVNFIITPETVFAENIKLQDLPVSWEVSILRTLLSYYPNVNWIAGASMIEFVRDKKLTTSQSNYLPDYGFWYNDYNSAFLLNRNAEVSLYHKSKLVVAVENFPYQQVLKPILGETLINLGGTVALKTTQPERTAFVGVDTEGKAAPIICYETIYGEFVTGYIKKGANFLAILTNDAWWRDTQGYKQLLSYTRLRAIETRRSVARSANTGVSAFINSRGDILKTLPYGTQGSLKGTIALNDEVTFYVQMGDYIARIAYFLAFFVFLYAVLRKREKRS